VNLDCLALSLDALDPLVLGLPTLAIRIVPILKVLLIAVFVLVALLMTFVILIQEGKGGGIAGAFGGAAAESFGVKAGSVNRFTAWLATIFIGLGVVYGAVSAAESQTVLGTEPPPPPVSAPSVVPGMTDDATPPAMDGAPPPAEPAMDAAGMDAAMGETPPPAPPAQPPAPPAPPAPAPEPAPPPAMEPGDTPPAPGMQ
jgi:protein translocase SecG subunit